MFFNKKKYTKIGKGVCLDVNSSPSLQDIKILNKNRADHLLVAGTKGSGKARFIESVIEQDLRNGRTLIFFDTQGDFRLINKLIQIVNEQNRLEELYCIIPAYPSFSGKINFNLICKNASELTDILMSGIISDDEVFLNSAENLIKLIINSLEMINNITKNNSIKEIKVDQILEYCSLQGVLILEKDLKVLNSDSCREIMLRMLEFKSLDRAVIDQIFLQLKSVLLTFIEGPLKGLMTKNSHNDFLQKLTREKKGVIVIQTGFLKDNKESLITSRIFFSLIDSLVRKAVCEEKKFLKPVSLIINGLEETASFRTPEFLGLCSKVKIHCIYTFQDFQSISKRIGRQVSEQIFNGTYAKVFMQQDDFETANYVALCSGKKKVYKAILQTGGNAAIRPGEEQVIQALDVKKLKKGEFYYMEKNGIFKGKLLSLKKPYIDVSFEMGSEKQIKN